MIFLYQSLLLKFQSHSHFILDYRSRFWLVISTHKTTNALLQLYSFMSIILPSIIELPRPLANRECELQPRQDLSSILLPLASEPCHNTFIGLEKKTTRDCETSCSWLSHLLSSVGQRQESRLIKTGVFYTTDQWDMHTLYKHYNLYRSKVTSKILWSNIQTGRQRYRKT